MLRCSALVRAPLRAPKQDVAHVTRTLSQLSINAQSSSLGSLAGRASSPARTFATKTATRTRSPAARKTTATTRERTTASKKAVAKKKPVSRRKAKPKAKAKPKPKPKKRVLTEKAKAALEKKKALASLRELKAVALVEPKGKPDSAWTVYVSEKLQGKGGTVTEGIKAASTEYKSLSASEREVSCTMPSDLSCIRTNMGWDSTTTTLPTRTGLRIKLPTPTGSPRTLPSRFARPTLHDGH